LISHRGKRLLERYFNGTEADDIANVKSVSKSLISALVGIAIARGHIPSVREPIARYFDDTAFQGTGAANAQITIEDLLTMQAGLETTSNRNYGAWVLSPNWIDFALNQPLTSIPGTRMQYSTGNTHLLSAILTRTTRMSTLEFAREHLSGPLGFRLAPWPRDPQGVYFGGNDMELTPNQMLAIGETYLSGGQRNGRQVIPAEWIDASFQPHAESPREEGRYYGYGWWIRNMAGFESPYAWGYGGQFILLVPELELVVVTTSSSNPGPDRRRHTRAMYDLVEYEVIAPFSRVLAGPD
jgi:CubicO group peptidase (beta-lactamase class C family)